MLLALQELPSSTKLRLIHYESNKVMAFQQSLCLKIIILLLMYFYIYSSEPKILTDLCASDHQESLLEMHMYIPCELQQPAPCVLWERKIFHWTRDLDVSILKF